MDYPYGHNHSHTHHHHKNDDHENHERSPYYQHNEFAPPHYQQAEFSSPPSHVTHDHHSGGGAYPPEHGSFNYPPAPSHVTVTHVAYESGNNMPSFPHHHSHSDSGLANKPSVKIFCKADPSFHLTIRSGKVILAPSDPYDDLQYWFKDEKFSSRVKDEEGCPCFALVNKVTGQALKHSSQAGEPVQLTHYTADHYDESILWSQSRAVDDDSYRAIRMVNNIQQNMDAFQADKNSGGVRDGTTVVLWQWKHGDNQLWKIIPY